MAEIPSLERILFFVCLVAYFNNLASFWEKKKTHIPARVRMGKCSELCLWGSHGIREKSLCSGVRHLDADPSCPLASLETSGARLIVSKPLFFICKNGGEVGRLS